MRPQIIVACILFFIGVVFSPDDSLFASRGDIQKSPVNIEADSMSYDSNSNIYRATGNVFITFVGGYLKADNVTLNRTTKDALAEGNVVIESEKDLLEGESARFNIDTKTGLLRHGRVFFYKNHLYLTGTEIEKTGEATYYLKDATGTTCEGDRPDWRFTGKELNVTIDGYGTVKHGTFQVKNFPFLYLPYMIFPAKTTRQTGLLFPRIAYSQDKLGWDMGIPFYWAISENTDATFYQRYMDKRGFQEGLEFRYFISETSFGTFYADYLADKMLIDSTEDTTTDALDRQWNEGQERWSYYLNHETTFSPGFYFRTDLVKVSDNWYFRDFSSSNYYLEHYSESDTDRFRKVSFEGDQALTSLESTARLVKEWELYNLTALVQYTDNLLSYSNDTTLQKYPEITFTGVKHPFYDSPVDFELETTYDYYYRTEGYSGHLLDVYPKFSLPLGFGDYLQFTPEIGLRETKWDGTSSDDTADAKRGSRELYDAGATLSTEVHRIFTIKGETVDKIRHGIKPEIIYTYIPYIYQNDLANFASTIAEENSVTYSLTNTLTAKLKDKNGGTSYKEFFILKLSQPYDLKEAQRTLSEPTDKRRPFGNLAIDFDFESFRYLSFEADAAFDVNAGEWKQTNYLLSASDWRGDIISAEYRYTQKTVEELNLSVTAKITDSIDIIYYLRRNELDRKDLEVTYGLDYHAKCWSVSVTYSDTSDDRSYMVIFSLYGLGKVGKVAGTPPRSSE